MNDFLDKIDEMKKDSGFQPDTRKAGRIMELINKFVETSLAEVEEQEFTGEEPYLQPEAEQGETPLIIGTQPIISSDTPQDMIKLMEEQLPITESRTEDHVTLKKATGIKAGVITGVAVLETIGLVAEALSLGQIETVTVMVQDIMSLTGLPDITRELMKIPLIKSVVIPYEQIFNERFTPYMPPVADLVRMRLREAIDEKEYSKALGYQGYEEKWRTAWWDAHWVLPALSQVYEMYYRGMDIPYISFDALGRRITGYAKTEEEKQEALAQFLKIADYEDLWHTNLLELSKRLPSKMDLRLMSQRVDLNPDMVDEVLKAEGLREDWLEPYADTVLHYRLGDLFSSRVNTAKRLYQDGLIEEAELLDLLSISKYSTKEIDVFLTTANLERREEEMKDLLTVAVNHFRRGRFTTLELFDTLKGVGYTITKAQLYVDMELSRMKQLPVEVEAPPEPPPEGEPET